MKKYNLIIGNANKDFSKEDDYPLGSWCFSREADLGNRYLELLENYSFKDPLERNLEKKEAYENCVKIYANILPFFVRKFKDTTQTNFDDKFYENFLYLYILIPTFLVYGRLSYIKNFFLVERNKEFIVERHDIELKPIDYDDFYNYILENQHFHNWLNMEIIKFLKPPNAEIRLKKPKLEQIEHIAQQSKVNLLYNQKTTLIESIKSLFLEKCIRIHNKKILGFFEIIFLNFFLYIDAIYQTVFSKKNDNHSFFSIKDSPLNDEEKLIADFVSTVVEKIFPQEAIADFSLLNDKALQMVMKLKFAKKSKVIDLLGKHTTSLLHRIYMSHLMKVGAKPIFIQHGAHYEAVQNLWNTLIEFRGYGFVSWGASIKNLYSKCNFYKLTFRSLKELSVRKNESHLKNETILFVGTAMRTLYSESIPCSNLGSSLERLKRKGQFFCNLSDALATKIIYRPLLCTSGSWLDSIAYLKSKDQRYLDLPILTEHSMLETALKSQLVVFDYYTTGCLQMFASDQPFIIYMNISAHCFDNKFLKFVERFKEVNIVFEDPVEAAEWINKISLKNDGISNWWTSNEVQSVKDDFIKQYIKLNKGNVLEWCNALWN